MVTKTSHKEFEQPEYFEFTAENFQEAQKQITKYPAGRQASAVKSLLYLVQKQSGWVPKAGMDYVASILNMPRVRVYEVASFYTMFNLQPVGRYHVRICRTTPCWLRGSDSITKACNDILGIGMNETTADGLFTLGEVECLGACVNAPVVQVNNDYIEDLNPEKTTELLQDLQNGKPLKAYSARGRTSAAPEQNAVTN